MPTHLYGDWDKAIARLSGMHPRVKRNFALATRRNAVTLRDQIKRTIRSGRSEWPPLSGLTIQRKGSSRPLVDNNDLFHSVTVRPAGTGIAFVGVPRSARSRERVSMVNIAQVMEFGAVITPTRAKFLTIPASKRASQLAREYGGTRNIPGLFVIPNPSGVPVALASRTGTGFTIMFVLLKKAKIPARSFIGSTFREVRPLLIRRYHQAVRAALRGEVYSAR